MTSERIRLHRIISWLLALLSLATIATGYALSRGVLQQYYFMSYIHRLFEWGFLALLVSHVVITIVQFKLNWSKLVQGLHQRSGTKIHLLRLVQRVSSWMIVLFAFFIVSSGLLGYDVIARALGDTIPFNWHRIFDVYLAVAIVIHVGVGLKFVAIRRRMKSIFVNLGILALVVTLLLPVGLLHAPPIVTTPVDTPLTVINDPNPLNGTINAFVTIQSTIYGFNSLEVETVRPDVFRPGSFSMFDVIVHLDRKSLVNLTYHFNASINTHVIDSLSGTNLWWYSVIYSGGWGEPNAFRMDLYPWKNLTQLGLHRTSQSWLNRLYNAWMEEVERLERNNGSLIVPEIHFETIEWNLDFYNITITPHNLRNETFQNGVITGIDVIMTLGELGLITYNLTWYDSIGSAVYVRNYFVTAINDAVQYGTCGWVYESGQRSLGQGNHIHLPSDSRVMTSPEYVDWFWICI